MKFRQIPAVSSSKAQSLKHLACGGPGCKSATKDWKQMLPSPLFLLLTHLSRGPHPAPCILELSWDHSQHPDALASTFNQQDESLCREPGHQYHQLPRLLKKVASTGTQCPGRMAAQTLAAAGTSVHFLPAVSFLSQEVTLVCNFLSLQLTFS